MIDYLRAHPRRCATSSSPAATSPTCRGRTSRRSSTRLLEIENIRDIRLATKALMGLPQHWLADDVVEGVGARVAPRPAARRLARDPHPRQQRPVGDAARSPRAARAMLDAGVRDVRNQGVLMRGVNDSPEALLDLCFALQDEAVDHAVLLLHVRHDPVREHWRLSLAEAQAPAARDHGLPARLRDAADRLRRALRRQALGAPGRGATTASAGSRTGARTTAPPSRPTTTEALSREYVYYDPIYTLPASGQEWWHASVDHESVMAEASQRAATSRAAAESQLVP